MTAESMYCPEIHQCVITSVFLRNGYIFFHKQKHQGRYVELYMQIASTNYPKSDVHMPHSLWRLSLKPSPKPHRAL